MNDFDSQVLAAIEPLCEAGFALHWLNNREKSPIEGKWSSKPVASLSTLLRRHNPGNNLGLRLGEPSKVGGGYVHVIDLDIRDPETGIAARAMLERLLPGVQRTHPSVISGSGGESRHYYLITSQPFSSTKLARSDSFKMVFDAKLNRDVKKRDWEIELFGTGKQVAMPPSIHPSGLPYRWERPLDLLAIEMGDLPWVDAARLEKAGADKHTTDAESHEPSRPKLNISVDEAEKILAALPFDQWCEDRDGWVQVGMALHHEFGEDGFDIWCDFSRASEKFDEKAQRSVWRSFKDKPKSIRMASLIAAGRAARYADAFDEAPDDDEPAPAPDDGLLDMLDGPSKPAARQEDELGNTIDDEDDSEPGSTLKWTSLLHFNEEGVLKPTLHNLELIVGNDPWLAGIAAYNEFTQETTQRANPGRKAGRRKSTAKPIRQLDVPHMRVADLLNGDLWTDIKDHTIRAVLEAPETQGGYGIKITDRDLKASIDISARTHAYHPVREYLAGLQWDGKKRVETLFIDYLGAANHVYSRDTARMMLIAAVARVHEPGHKFDFAVILEGIQGKGKSTFIATLAKHWFAELDGDFSDSNKMVEQMQGAWVLEIPELSGFARSDVRHIKAVISRQDDKTRLAYERRAKQYPRQCIFIGSTNDKEYLRDDSGGRRFWPMPCIISEIDIAGLRANVDQIWAEAYAIYRQMRVDQPYGTLPLYLTNPVALAEAMRLQESRRVESADDGIIGQIMAWLDRPQDDGRLEGSDTIRNRVCLMQIWVEVMHADRKSYNQQSAQTLGRAMNRITGWEKGETEQFPSPYGRQRAYFRV